MTSEPNQGTKDRVAGRIAGGILWVQQKISERMNRLKNLKVILTCFCLVSAGLSAYYIVDAIVAKPRSAIKIDRIQTLRPINEPSDKMYDAKVPDEIYHSIRDYRKHMDSIGEPIRPGLADSMRLLEEMYLQQIK